MAATNDANGLVPGVHSTPSVTGHETGFTMIEVLVALLIIVLGLLGLAGLQVRMQQAEFESYQRAQALILLYDVVDRINVNRAAAKCFALTDASTGAPFLGVGGSAPATCSEATTVENNAMAAAAMAEWDSLLEGAAETKGSAVGAVVGGRGCVSYADDPALPGTGIYTVTVAWQGTAPTVSPSSLTTPNNCAKDQYGAGADDARRRVVSTTLRLGKLN